MARASVRVARAALTRIVALGASLRKGISLRARLSRALRGVRTRSIELERDGAGVRSGPGPLQRAVPALDPDDERALDGWAEDGGRAEQTSVAR